MSQTLPAVAAQPPSPEAELVARIERRVGRLHARQRLGVEQDHEKNFDRGISLDNSRRLRALIRGILKVTGLYERGLRNTERIVVRHNEAHFRNLPPKFEGFTLLHITDLHADMSVRAMRRLAEILPGLDYDVCVITGDFRGETLGPFDECMAEMARLRPYLRKPVYTVLGNHDTIRMVPTLEDMGIRVLLNESVTIERGNERIHLAGIDDAHLYHLQNFERATAEIPPGAFSILLSHTPETYRQATHADFAFFLAGHTHGGQLCLPGSIPMKLEAKMPRRLGKGAWKHHSMMGYTSVGVGSCIVPVRFNCPPEITLHHLKRI
ncbi:MAG TPA: metallophosphoesterase [Candidatus Acidoferrales bacterium]|jgi:hypothetical protein|nr:metallophosphoesterase [Candidatus Acidoferrales bacterium]